MPPPSLAGRARVADDLTPKTSCIACEALSIVSQIETHAGPSGRMAGFFTGVERRDVTATEQQSAKDVTTATVRDRTRASAGHRIEDLPGRACDARPVVVSLAPTALVALATIAAL